MAEKTVGLLDALDQVTQPQSAAAPAPKKSADSSKHVGLMDALNTVSQPVAPKTQPQVAPEDQTPLWQRVLNNPALDVADKYIAQPVQQTKDATNAALADIPGVFSEPIADEPGVDSNDAITSILSRANASVKRVGRLGKDIASPVFAPFSTAAAPLNPAIEPYSNAIGNVMKAGSGKAQFSPEAQKRIQAGEPILGVVASDPGAVQSGNENLDAINTEVAGFLPFLLFGAEAKDAPTVASTGEALRAKGVDARQQSAPTRVSPAESSVGLVNDQLAAIEKTKQEIAAAQAGKEGQAAPAVPAEDLATLDRQSKAAGALSSVAKPKAELNVGDAVPAALAPEVSASLEKRGLQIGQDGRVEAKPSPRVGEEFPAFDQQAEQAQPEAPKPAPQAASPSPNHEVIGLDADTNMLVLKRKGLGENAPESLQGEGEAKPIASEQAPATPQNATEAQGGVFKAKGEAGANVGSEISGIVKDVRAEQQAFLDSKGMTMEQARALDEQGRAKLQKEWEAFRAAKKQNPTPAAPANVPPPEPGSAFQKEFSYQSGISEANKILSDKSSTPEELRIAADQKKFYEEKLAEVRGQREPVAPASDVTLGSYHQREGRAAVVESWLAKHQKAGRAAFASGDELYAQGERATLVRNDDGTYSIRRDHDLTKDGFASTADRNFGSDEWTSSNKLADDFVNKRKAEEAARVAGRERVAADARSRGEASQRQRDETRQSVSEKVARTKFTQTTAKLPMPDGSTVDVKGPSAGGLIVHRAIGGDGFDVSHAASGLRANSQSFPSQAEAKAAAVRLLEAGDWSRSAEQLGADKAFTQNAGSLSRAMAKHGAFATAEEIAAQVGADAGVNKANVAKAGKVKSEAASSTEASVTAAPQVSQGKAAEAAPPVQDPNRVVPGARSAYTGSEVSGSPLAQITDAIKRAKDDSRSAPGGIIRAARDAASQHASAISEAAKSAATAASEAFRAYSAKPKWSTFHDALGEYLAQREKSAIELKRFAKSIKDAIPDVTRREALSNYIEAAGDQAVLRQRMEATTNKRLKSGYQAALNLSDSERLVANHIISLHDSLLEESIKAGILEHGADNYIQHVWEKSRDFASKAKNLVSSAMLQTNPKFALKRVFPTFFDGEQAGYNPATKDAGYLTTIHQQSFTEALAARRFVKDLLEKKAKDGRPLGAITGIGVPVESPSGDAYMVKPNAKPAEVFDYKTIDHPALRKWKWAVTADGKPVFVQGDIVVHPDVANHLKNVLDKSWFRDPNAGAIPRAFGAFAKASREIKATILSLSAFHQVQEGVHAVGHNVFPAGMPELDLENPTQYALVKHGLRVADFHAAEQFGEGVGGAGLTAKLPIVGERLQQYQHYLFQDYIPRLKMKMAMDALERNTKRYTGELSPDEIQVLTANQANAAFGGLNYKMLGRNPTVQDFLSMTLLAPDFLEARGRFVGQALKPYGMEQRAALVRISVEMYVGARLLNYAISGNARVDDPRDAFAVVAGGKRYELRSIPGDVIHLISDPRSFIYNRLNPTTTRQLAEWLTGRDSFGRKQTLPQQAKEFGRNLAPIPVRGLYDQSNRTPAESFLEGLGIHSTKDDTPAERLARQYALDQMPAGERQQEDIDKSRRVRETSDKLRNKEIGAPELLNMVKQGKLSRPEAERVIQRSQESDLQRNFKPLTLPRALEVWDKMSPEEQDSTRLLLAKKIPLLQKYDPSYQNELKAKLREALGKKPSQPQPAILSMLKGTR